MKWRLKKDLQLLNLFIRTENPHIDNYKYLNHGRT